MSSGGRFEWWEDLYVSPAKPGRESKKECLRTAPWSSCILSPVRQKIWTGNFSSAEDDRYPIFPSSTTKGAALNIHLAVVRHPVMARCWFRWSVM